MLARILIARSDNAHVMFTAAQSKQWPATAHIDDMSFACSTAANHCGAFDTQGQGFTCLMAPTCLLAILPFAENAKDQQSRFTPAAAQSTKQSAFTSISEGFQACGSSAPQKTQHGFSVHIARQAVTCLQGQTYDILSSQHNSL